MRFRPELEGLRGVAVALVVLFHARLLGFAGGFIGVDVFYVLSGYLITKLLLGEMVATGGLDLVSFYAKRARRILPAAITAVVVVLAFSALVVAPLDLPNIAVDATASGLFAGNVLFAIRSTDYFASTTPSPFLHYWSLGVEEQFYLVWPLFLLFAFRARRPLLITTVACIASLALAISLTPILAPWAFYSLPTRAWQLAAGALLAMSAPTLARLPSLPLGLGAWVGIAVLGTASIVLDAQGYPGVVALLPTLSVALVICGSDRRGGPGRLLASRPLRALGRISFSLYLYHWPVLVLASIAFGDLSTTARWCLVGLSVVVAILSRRLVEEPFLRHGQSRATSRSSLLLAGRAIAAVLVVAQLVGLSAASTVAASDELRVAEATALPSIEPTPTAVALRSAPAGVPVTATPVATPAGPRELRPRVAEARDDGDGLNARGCGLSLRGTNPPLCDLGVPDGAITVALVGDSHAAQWFPALDLIAQGRGWRIVPFTKDSCIFLDMRIVSLHLEREYTECAAWRANVVAALQRLRPDLVVVSSSRWVHPVESVDKDAARQADAMVRLLGAVPGRVAIIADTPLSEVDVPACLSRKDRTADSCASSRGYALTAHLARDGRAAKALGAVLIDPSVWLCDEQICPAVIDWTIVYRDDHHLTATMARRLAPLLEPGLLEALSRP